MSSSSTIRKRLIQMQLLTAIAVLMFASFAFMAKDFFQLRETLVRQMSSASSVLTSNMVSALVFHDAKEVQKTLGSLSSLSNIKNATVIDPQGNLLAHSGTNDGREVKIQDFQSSKEKIRFEFNSDSLSIYSRIEQEGDLVGGLYMEATLDGLRESYQQSAMIIAIVLMLGVLVSWIWATISQHSLSSPIKTLAHTLKEVSGSGTYSIRVKNENSIQELKELTDQFNHMIALIESRDLALRESNESLERKVAERTEQLELIQKDALLNAHAAGMAQVAVGVLHNIGNILNSVNVGAENMLKVLGQSKIEGFLKSGDLLRQNRTNLAAFFTQDPKGNALIDYYLGLCPLLQGERDTLKKENEELLKRIQLIKDVITTQQTYAKAGHHAEPVSITEVLDTALSMQNHSLVRHGIEIVREIDSTPPVLAQKAKLVHVVLNILKNAKEAMSEMVSDEKKILLEAGVSPEIGVYLRISDTGSGISKQDLEKIFSYGFTTKKTGHGFGLHHCATTINEMGGQLSVSSAGIGKGAAFTISFPLKTEARAG